MAKKAEAYTDGSYNKEREIYGCGVVLLIDGEEPDLLYNCGTAQPGKNGWNINGEITAAIMAIQAAIKAGVTDLTIYHDYEGVGKWPDRLWRANKSYTAKYADDVNEYRKKINIRFSWVKGHSSNQYNDIADSLAKYGAGITDYLPAIAQTDATAANNGNNVKNTSTNGQSDSQAPDVINPECREGLCRFLGIKNPSFKDFANLKTGGRDAYSSLGTCTLEAAVGNAVCTFIKSRINSPDGYLPALRWVLRGLKPDDAAHKVNVDAEIRKNMEMGRR